MPRRVRLNAAYVSTAYSRAAFLSQVARGGVVRFKRRGWDFGVGKVIQMLHENVDFRRAASDCVMDFAGEDFWGSPYASLLDKLTNGVFSKREVWHESGWCRVRSHCACIICGCVDAYTRPFLVAVAACVHSCALLIFVAPTVGGREQFANVLQAVMLVRSSIRDHGRRLCMAFVLTTSPPTAMPRNLHGHLCWCCRGPLSRPNSIISSDLPLVGSVVMIQACFVAG